MFGSTREAILRLVGALLRLRRADRHPHLCAFVVMFDNRPFGEGCEPIRILRVPEWLK